MSEDLASARSEDPSRPTRSFGPPAPVVLGTLVAAVIFVVVLEFLVIISFVGQRLWQDPRILRDVVFTLPLALWLLVAVLAVVLCLRVITAWLRIDEQGVTIQGLCRRPRTALWTEVGRVIAVRDIDRGATPAEMLDAAATAYDGVYVLDQQGHRVLSVSSRFFGIRAQNAALDRAREAGVQIDEIEAITTSALRERAPQAMTLVDRHPNAVLLLVLAFYIMHNVLTFAVWGL